MTLSTGNLINSIAANGIRLPFEKHLSVLPFILPGIVKRHYIPVFYCKFSSRPCLKSSVIQLSLLAIEKGRFDFNQLTLVTFGAID